MRSIDVPVYVGVMKGTENNETPNVTVIHEPFNPPHFDNYTWWRSTVRIRIQDDVTETSATKAESVK